MSTLGYGAFAATPRRRVVVTGIGMVTPLGIGARATWEALLSGKSGTRRLEQFPGYVPACAASPERKKALLAFPCQVAAPVLPHELGFPMEAGDPFTATSRASRAQLFALRAAHEAMLDAFKNSEGAVPQEQEPRVGVNIGLGMPSLQDVTDVCADIYGDPTQCHYKRISPFFVPKILGNAVSGAVAMRHRLRGPNHSAVTACATGAHCIGDAARWIMYGDCDAVLCGATEACITPVAIAGFCRMKALATRHNERPEAASRPFDAGRSGFVMGEGSGVLFLEELQSALKRGAHIYGEVRGYGMSGDAHHISSPHPEGRGAMEAVRAALRDGGVSPRDVAYVNAHATGTPVGDEIELAALTASLRGTAGEGTVNPLTISSSKGGFGHLLGAAGAVEAIVALLALHHRTAPPNVNLEVPVAHDKTLVTLPTSAVPLASDTRAVLSTSFGFGGTNAALLFSRVDSTA